MNIFKDRFLITAALALVVAVTPGSHPPHAGFHVGLADAVEDKVDEIVGVQVFGWPQRPVDPAIFTTTIGDSLNDFENTSDDPPAITPFKPIDVASVKLGVSWPYFYLRVDYQEIIPTQPPVINGEIVTNQFFDFACEMDGDGSTGAGLGAIGGVDIQFGVGVNYGQNFINSPYMMWDFPTQIADDFRQIRAGEYLAGGPGTNFIVARYEVSGLSPWLFPRGSTVRAGGWSEAKSVTYHHYSFDSITAIDWTIP